MDFFLNEGQEAQHAAPAPQTLGKPREEAVCITNPTPITWRFDSFHGIFLAVILT